jgi:hypothetical protein
LVLSGGPLKDAGVSSGDHVVMLFNSQAAEPQIPMDTVPVRSSDHVVWDPVCLCSVCVHSCIVALELAHAATAAMNVWAHDVHMALHRDAA